MKRTRIVIAEDHEATQYILRRVLEPLYDIAAVVSDGLALLEAVEAHQPTCVVSDLSMPVMNGLSATRRLKATHPEIKVIIVSAHSEQVYRDEVLKAGADAYILKGSLARDLVECIEKILPTG